MTAKSFHNEPLYVGTKDLHHACEQHPVGAAMSRGDICDQWWADWLGALHIIHSAIDPELPEPVWRVAPLEEDIAASNVPPRDNEAAKQLGERLDNDKQLREAAYYVITGAHLMGGQVMRVTLKGRVPGAHLHIPDRKQWVDEWAPLRKREDLVDKACAVFQALLEIMDEILERDKEEPCPA